MRTMKGRFLVLVRTIRDSFMEGKKSPNVSQRTSKNQTGRKRKEDFRQWKWQLQNQESVRSNRNCEMPIVLFGRSRNRRR